LLHLHRYYRKAEDFKNILTDKAVGLNGLDQAVFWSEFLARNGPKLTQFWQNRASVLKLTSFVHLEPWYRVYMVDVALLFSLIAFGFLWLVYVLMRLVLRSIL